MKFRIEPSKVDLVETRRGVNAFAPIMQGDEQIGNVEDYAERVCTPVHFVTPEKRTEFLAAAKEWSSDHNDDSMLISEYARHLLTEALDKLG